MAVRDISFSTIFNFRDMGGLPGADGRCVRTGCLYRSDSLHRLTLDERERLAELGVRTVLDLRRPYEVARDGRVPDLPGLAYFNIHPVHREWNPAMYDPSLGAHRYLADRYLDMAEEGIDGIGGALRLIADPGRTPLVMHCFAGKDRTGVVAALTLSLLGVADEDIARDYAYSEMAQGTLSARLRAEAPIPGADPAPLHFVVCPPQAIETFLSELAARYGSVRRYTAAAGVTDAHVAAMRAHLLEP